ncbi:MAG: TetR/AcrR family transcriptional regulator [Spirochaetes bacterium]|nr:TetR/AcrR family transcriptional regulator [Spirochaetota bacterium]
MKWSELVQLDSLTPTEKGRFYKDAFEKISPEKKEKILTAAIHEFAQKGFNAANINHIAKNAGISIGSMYNYFSSKEDLYLTLIDYGYKLLESVISQIDLSEGSLYDKLEKLLKAACEYSQKYSEMIHIYIDISSEGLSHLSERLSRKMESISALFYQKIIDAAKRDGLVLSEIDTRIASFCIDNILMMVQFSYAAKYYAERLKIFTGIDPKTDNPEILVHGIMQFFRRALGGEKQ